MTEVNLFNWIITTVTLVFIFALSVTDVKSQNLPSAKILSSSGSVQITRSSTNGAEPYRIGINVGEKLFAGDVIKTGFGGRLVIALRDGSQAVISQNTTVEIKDANNSPRTIFNILRGKTRIKIERLGGKPNPYRITTPTTVIAVRGTIFDVFVSGDETRVFVDEGEVSVVSLFFPEQEIILTPGFFTRVKKDQPPQSPGLFKPGRNNSVFNPVSSNGAGRGVFDNPSQDNPGKSGFPNGSGFPGNSGNAPGRNPNVAPGNSGNAPGRRGKP
jgi:hypothetical protein